MDNNDLYKTILETDDLATSIDLSSSIDYVPSDDDDAEADGKTVLDNSAYDESYVSYAQNATFSFEVEGIDDDMGETPLSNYLQPDMVLKENRYKIIKAVGVGGFGIVYRAFDSKLNIEVAMKELYPSSLVNRVPGEKKMVIYGKENARQYAYLLDRFILEARSMAKFNSVKNIVNIYDCFQENNTAYIVMEFIKGKNLEDYVVSHGGRLNIETANKFFCEILDGLSAIHNKGIIHRDIKPRNIFITENDEVKIIDFGAARFSSTEETVVTRYSKVLTPGFAPPEQYRRDSKQGPYTDIYAAGAVYYYMLTGLVPEISVDRVVDDEVKPIESVVKNIPDHAARAVSRALELNSDLRIQSAAEFKSGIQGKKIIRTVMEEKKLRFKRRLAIIASTAAVLCMAALGVIYYRVNYGGQLSIDKLLDDDTRISVCIPLFSGNSLANSQISAWETTSQDFEKYVSDNSKYDVDVDLKYLSYETYMDDYESGNKTTVFFSYDSSNSAGLMHMNRLLTEESTLLYDSYYKGSISLKSYVIGFDPTVLYVNQKLLREIGENSNVDNYKSIEDITSLTIQDDITLLRINGIDKEYYSQLTGYTDDGVMPALEEFCSGNVIFYIGHVSDNLTAGTMLPGYFKITNAPDVDGIRAVPYEWQVESVCSKKEVNAAQIWFSFISGEDAQDLLFVQSGYMMPVNPVAFEKFIDYNPEFEFVRDNIKNIHFIGH